LLQSRVMTSPVESPESTLDPNSLARLAVQIASDKKAEDLLMLDIRGLSVIADYFVICTGTSDRQVRAISKELQEQLKAQGARPSHVEGMDAANWVLLDYGSVIIHVFDPATRDYYRLERHWAEAPRVLVVQ
jgi:ribosome-associated protein